MLLLWKLRREEFRTVSLSGGPRRMTKYKEHFVPSTYVRKEFPKHSWWRKMQRAASARIPGAGRILGNWVEWKRYVQTQGIR